MITVQRYKDYPDVIHHKAVGNWDWDTYYARLDEAWGMIAEAGETTHILIDFLESEDFPSGTLLNAHRGFKNRPRNVGMVIVIDKRRRTAMFFDTLLRVNSRLVPAFADVRFVTTLEEAESLIDDHNNHRKASNDEG